MILLGGIKLLYNMNVLYKKYVKSSKLFLDTTYVAL